MNLLITGGCGFIGSHLVEKLSTHFNKIFIIDNLITGKIDNIQPFLSNNIIFIKGDLTDLNFLKNFFSTYHIDIINHQAALGSVPRSIIDPLSTHNNNVNAFINLLICCKDFNIKRFVYASSSSVYGDEDTLPKTENKTGQLLSPYAVSKKIDELYAHIFFKTYNIETIGLRYFNVFGKRQDPNGPYSAVIPRFVNLMKNNQDIIINGDPNFSRDFTYIDNVVQANLKALTTKNNLVFGDVINICAGGNITLTQLIDTLKTHINTSSNTIIGPYRQGDIPHSFGNFSKANELIDYYPHIDFFQGIKLMLS